MVKIEKGIKGILSKINAPDGYVVDFIGKDYRDEIEWLDMLVNDYDGYEIVEMRQSSGTKKRLHFLLADR